MWSGSALLFANFLASYLKLTQIEHCCLQGFLFPGTKLAQMLLNKETVLLDIAVCKISAFVTGKFSHIQHYFP